MKTIKLCGQICCIIYEDADWVRGLNFITPNDMFIQAGSWWYDAGTTLQRHYHNEFDRVATRTQETVYVRRGRLRVDLYDHDQNYFQDFIMKEGDFAVFACGGHGYEILDDDTQILETKNGPFIDVETDKTKF